VSVGTTLPGIISNERDTYSSLSYTPSNPIVIESNADFETQGWPGEGTSEQPYEISGLNITSSGTCIDIRTTDVYFIIEDCLLISNNTVAYETVYLWYVDNVTITRCVIECQNTAMLVEHCENCHFNDNILWMCEWGIRSVNIKNCSFIGNSCSNISRTVFDINFSEDTSIIGNAVVDSDTAVSLSHTPTNYLAGNRVGNCTMGLIIGFSPDSVLRDNIMVDVGLAYSLYHSSDSIIENNSASGSLGDGIHLNYDTNIQVIGNSISGATDCGMSLGASNSVNDSVIRDNRIFANYFGIYIFRGQNNTLYGNAFGAHEASVAHDNGENNTWDDGVSEGNYWHDYSGEGVYYITGEDSIDRYPRQMMLFDGQPDQSFESGLMGHSIIWNIEDPFPYRYTISINGNISESGPWNWSDYEISLDTLLPGIYNFTLLAINEVEINVTDTVAVEIWPSEAPSIVSRPEDFNVTEGDTRSLVWRAQDHSPASYHIYLNDTLYQEGAWSGNYVSITETWNTTGNYNYTIWFVDQLGQVTVDVVIVTVNQASSDDNSLNDENSLSLILTIIFAVSLVSITSVVLLIKKKQ